MSNYVVESYEIRKRLNGEDYLILTLCGRLVSFYDKEEIKVDVQLGDVVSCEVMDKNDHLNGFHLKILSDTEDVPIETSIKIVDRLQKSTRDTRTTKITKKSSKKHNKLRKDTYLPAGGRVYYFNVRTTAKGDPYLTVTEQRGNNRNSIYIFQDHAADFERMILDALQQVKE